ncbi:dipicolinate synthase subunit DpsA [Propionivibrio dicarboxylicus]|uniref:Dipicolinate synthase subunit A n=1 Tax=Propionivibrio dicarboxylicus TaxID=83767 RepID=A0A1G8NC78_9RHOO|nr:dipicolinate synthase subunit DpsA [Propionivibrio dicarboxylicus]SDI77735.1 dipicolinate synthase subunit A [Propionivibrio dicarboxylicus]
MTGANRDHPATAPGEASTPSLLIIGGDRRNACLAAHFAAAGLAVCTLALDEKSVIPAWNDPVWQSFNAIVGPIPFSEDGKTLHAPLHAEKIAIADFLDALAETATLYAGTLPADSHPRCRTVDLTKNLALYDRNLVATAEGVLQTLLNQIEFTLAGSDILVAGYGKVGRIVAQRLNALDARVAVYSADPRERARIPASLRSTDLADLSVYRIVINTIPARVFDAGNLPTLDRSALLLDVSSFPGGVDSSFAAKTGLQLLRAPGLPGRKAPETVAAAMSEVILADIGPGRP